nr:hypothetical protein MACL_00002310 [Theileria orientalis]
MYVRRTVRSLLIYLLLCYGKKFIDAEEFDKRKRISLSQESLTSNQQRSNSHNERSHQSALNVTQLSHHCNDSNSRRISIPEGLLVQAQNQNNYTNKHILYNGHHGDKNRKKDSLISQRSRDSEAETSSISSYTTSSKSERRSQYRRKPSDETSHSSSEESKKGSQCQMKRRGSEYFLTVDIDAKVSSPYIVYERDALNNTETFRAVSPYLIDMVKSGDEVLWTPNECIFSDKVLIRHDEQGNPILRVYYPELEEQVSETSSGFGVADTTPEPGEPIPTFETEGYLAPIEEHLDALSAITEDESVKLIALDVNKTYTTSKVIHKVEIDGSQTLTCKMGYLIYKVLEGDTELWKHQEGEYPYRVIIGVNYQGAKVVDIRFPGDELLVALDVTYTSSTKEIIYLVEPDGTESFNCRPGFLISKITKGSKYVWEGKEPPYSDRVVLYYDEKGVKNAYVQFYKEYREPPQLTEVYEYIETRRQEPIEYVTVDINEKRSSSRIVFIRNVRRNRNIYTAISPHLIDTVKSGTKVLWKAKDNIYSDKVLIRHDEKGCPVLRVYYPRDYEREYEHATTAIVRSIKEELEQAKPPTLGPREELTLHIIDPRRREKVEMAVGEEMYVLSKRYREPEEEEERYPDNIMMLYDRRGKPVFRVSYPPEEKPELEVPRVKPIPEVPEALPPRELPKVVPKPEVKPPPEVPKVEPEEDMEIIERKEEEKPPEPIILDITTKKTTEELGFLVQDNIATYLPKAGKAFKLVTSGNDQIWRKSEKEEYANKVIMDGLSLMTTTKNVTVYLTDGKIIHFNKTRKGWRKMDPEIQLNINRTSVDFKFDYNIGFDEATYTPKSNFIFKGISDNTAMNEVLSWCTPTTKEIHTSHDKAEYSKKVIRDGTAFMARIKHVSMYLENGTYKHFYRKSRFYPWREISHKISLDVNVKETCYRYEYKVYDTGTYSPKYDFVFKRIYQSPLLWKFSEGEVIWNAEKEEECAIKVVIDGTGANSTPSNVTIYLVNGQIRHFSRPTFFSKWREISKDVALDISKIESTLQIDFTLQGKFQYYVANHDFKIKKVVDRNVVLWEAKTPNYCKRAMLRGARTQNKELTLYLPSGPRIFRKQGKKNPWVEATDESAIKTIDVTKNLDENKMEEMKRMHEELLKTFTHEKVHITVEGLSEGEESGYEVKEEGEDKIYELKKDKKCLEVKYGARSLWKYDKEKYWELYPKKIHFMKGKLLVIVDFDIAGLLFRYGPKEEMNLIYSRRPVPLEVDLEDFEPMDEIEYNDQSSYATYEPKHHYSINPLKCGNVKIHDTNDFFNYILKLKVEPARNAKRVYIELVNGKKKHFTKTDEKTWKEVAF